MVISFWSHNDFPGSSGNEGSNGAQAQVRDSRVQRLQLEMPKVINLEDGLPGLGYVVNNQGDRKSPNWGCGTPAKWPKWLINGGY